MATLFDSGRPVSLSIHPVTLVDASGTAISGSNPLPSSATIVTGDIEIGSVELKNGADDTRAKIGASTGVAESDNALAVKDPVTGVTTGAAVITDANGTLQGYLRGLVKLVAAKIGITIANGDAVPLGSTADAAVTTDTTGTVVGFLRGLVKLWIAGLAAGEAHVGAIGGNKKVLAVEITRENNATPYGIGDVVSAAAATVVPAMDFATAGRVNGGTGYVVGAKLIYNVKSVVPRTRVHLFNVNTATVSGDNLPWSELYADSSKRIGYFDMPAMVTGADAANSDQSRTISFDFRLPYVCAAASQHVYAVLETLDAVTLTANSKATLTLMFEQD